MYLVFLERLIRMKNVLRAEDGGVIFQAEIFNRGYFKDKITKQA